MDNTQYVKMYQPIMTRSRSRTQSFSNSNFVVEELASSQRNFDLGMRTDIVNPHKKLKTDSTTVSFLICSSVDTNL